MPESAVTTMRGATRRRRRHGRPPRPAGRRGWASRRSGCDLGPECEPARHPVALVLTTVAAARVQPVASSTAPEVTWTTRGRAAPGRGSPGRGKGRGNLATSGRAAWTRPGSERRRGCPRDGSCADRGGLTAAPQGAAVERPRWGRRCRAPRLGRWTARRRRSGGLEVEPPSIRRPRRSARDRSISRTSFATTPSRRAVQVVLGVGSSRPATPPWVAGPSTAGVRDRR